MSAALPGPRAVPAPPARRRLYLMRHGSVSYFPENGPPADAERVELSEAGRAQADAAGRFFAEHGVRFDRVIATGLPRTEQTAQRVLAQLPAAARAPLEHWPALQELRSGHAEAALEGRALRDAFLAPFEGEPAPEVRFRGGESIGEFRDRVLPAIERLLAEPDWQVALVVAHGAVNRVVLSWALTGARTLLANFQQAPACINALDVAPLEAAPAGGVSGALVRFANLAPYDPAQRDVRDSTMETLLAQYLAHGG